MEQRLKNLEDLSELITKEIVQQNKSMIDLNTNLLSEIKSLREAYVKQDEDFEEFKNLLKKIYELNKQQGSMHSQIPLPMFPSQSFPPPFNSGIPNLNNSFMLDQVNQSMLNNLSFQSERTPLNQNQQNPNNSCYSVPSSASAMVNPNQQQFTPYFNAQMQPMQSIQQQPQQVNNYQSIKPPQPHVTNLPSGKPINTTSSFNNILNSQPIQNKPLLPVNDLNKPPVPQNGTDTNKLEQQRQFPASLTTQTTSTPQPNQFSFSKLQQQSEIQNKPKPPQFQFSPSKQVDKQVKPAQPLTSTTQATTTSIFGSNLFKTTPEKQSQKSSIFGTTPPVSTISQPLFKVPEPTKLNVNDEDDTDIGGANPEEFEPQLDFKPLVKLQEVEVKTGEEDEDILFKSRCKLFRFDMATKEWKEKGLGDIKILKHKKTNVIRILMRREQVHKICANHRISSIMVLKELAPKQYTWTATDFSDNSEAKPELLLVKFKLPEEAANFKTEFEKAVEASKNLPKTPVKPQDIIKTGQPVVVNKLKELLKTDDWKCTGCYASNKKDEIKCVCCNTYKPGYTAPIETTSIPTTTTPAFSFGLKPDSTINKESSSKPFSFGTAFTAAPQAPATIQATQPFSFGTTTASSSSKQIDLSTKTSTTSSTSEQAKPLNLFSLPATGAPSLFSNNNMPSFSSLAASSSKSLFGNLDSNISASPILKNTAFSGGLQPNLQPPKPLFSTLAATSKPDTTDVDDADNAGNGENPEDYEPQVDFKPIVKLQEVEVKTGEENEIVVFKSRCKLYRFDNTLKEWKEKGTGEMKILRNKDHENMYRILMRRDQVLKLCANHRITLELNFELFNEKQIRWHAQDYSEGECKHELLAARFKNEEEAKLFKKECDDALKILKSENSTPTVSTKPPNTQSTNSCTGLKSSLSELFKTDNTWKCTACYAPNKIDMIKCACCSTLKPGAVEPPVNQTEKTIINNFGKISFGAPISVSETKITQPILFGQQSNSINKNEGPAKFDFGTKTNIFQPFTGQSIQTDDSKTSVQSPATSSIFKTATSNPLFGNATAVDSGSIFGTNKIDMSFADLAKKTQPTGFGGGFIGSNSAFNQPATGLFSNFNKQAPPPLFGSQGEKKNDDAHDENDENNQNPEEYEPQLDFKPIVKLQEVEVKTGEEDEDVLFKQRCKLFRFNSDTKEWKEKGVGDIKILKHKFKENHFRILMRRDQVLKLCANHRINTTIKLESINEKQLSWIATDCSEDEPHTEVLAVRFRHEEDATKFKNEFEKVQKILLTNPVSTEIPDSTNNDSKNAPKNENKFSALIKKEAVGSWKCNTCLTINKPDSNSCACCQAEKTNKDTVIDSVVIINTIQANKEQIDKARQFKLPDNFYLYENKADCKGCRGCDN